MTEAECAARLAEALDVARRLPAPRSLGPGNVYRYLIVSKDADDPEEIDFRLHNSFPDAEELERFDEVIDWLSPLPVPLRKLLWLRADANTWRFIGRILGYNPRYCQRLWRDTIGPICALVSSKGPNRA